MIKRLACIFALLTVATVGMASEDTEPEKILKQNAPDSFIDTRGRILTDEVSPSDPQQLAQSSIRCGIAPIPPVGCRVGQCVCDNSGQNCKWTFVCN